MNCQCLEIVSVSIFCLLSGVDFWIEVGQVGWEEEYLYLETSSLSLILSLKWINIPRYIATWQCDLCRWSSQKPFSTVELYNRIGSNIDWHRIWGPYTSLIANWILLGAQRRWRAHEKSWLAHSSSEMWSIVPELLIASRVDPIRIGRRTVNLTWISRTSVTILFLQLVVGFPLPQTPLRFSEGTEAPPRHVLC